MLSTNQIEALSNSCARCGKTFTHSEFCTVGYLVNQLNKYYLEADLSIAVHGPRPVWTHASCTDPKLKGVDVIPTIHNCVKCKNPLGKNDVVNPVFRVDDPDVTNPSDPTDKGISLGDRMYFAHVDCTNQGLNKSQGNIILL